MRTTLSLDDDVAAMLQTAQQRQKKPFKQIVNDALRAGLAQQRRPGDGPRVFAPRRSNWGGVW